ncbi:MAG: hypothetical protein IT406_00305 [Candidatus Yanofskybacteria bacterium]|nr:hypothetical protein [Candidatus Yanofskybacteria bacterium]
MDLAKIGEVARADCWQVANELLKEGWVLLSIKIVERQTFNRDARGFTKTPEEWYILGKPRGKNPPITPIETSVKDLQKFDDRCEGMNEPLGQ